MSDELDEIGLTDFKATKQDALGFISTCMGQAEADGYQQMEEGCCEERLTRLCEEKIEWFTNSAADTMTLKIGDQSFNVKVTKAKGPAVQS